MIQSHSHSHTTPHSGPDQGHGRREAGIGRGLLARRRFLATVATGLAGLPVLEQAFVRAAAARVQSAGAPARLFEIEKVADGIYAALARPAAMINSNAAVFVNDRDVLVMDTHSKPSAAASLIAQIRKEITSKPVKYVVNSHFHWDHMQGNSAYRRAYPEAQFVSSRATRRLMSEEAVSRLKTSLQDLPRVIEQSRKSLAGAASGEEKAFYRRQLEEQVAYAKEMESFSLELPTHTFGETLILHEKAHTLELSFCGRAHTAGDVVIFCPEKKVVATGDMVHGFFPFIGDGYPRDWPKTMDAVGGLGFETIIGGHGPVQRDRLRFRHMRDYIEELTAKVEDGRKAGRTVEELQSSIGSASIRALQTDGYAELLREALLRFRLILPGAFSLDDEVRRNIADIYQRLGNT